MKKIPLMKNTFSNENFVKQKLIEFIKSSSRLSMGQEVRKWEKNFSKWQKRKYSVCVNSGSSANLILIQSLLNLNYIKKNDLVAVSGVTWSTNVMPLIQLGLEVKAIDVSLTSLNVSFDHLKKFYKKNKNLKCFFLTNVLGFSDRINKIRSFCLKNKILLIEDNCESLGSEIKNKKLGNFGIASTTSTFVGHHLSTIEGGFVCTDNRELYNQLLVVRAHGWDRNLSEKEKFSLNKKYKISKFFRGYSFFDLAYNVRPTEICGKLGNLQIKNLSKDIKIREKNFKKFTECIDNNINLYKLNLKHMSLISNFAFPVIAKNKFVFDKLRNNFIKNKVEIRPIISGNILSQPFMKKYVKQNQKNLKNSSLIHNLGFYFPNNPNMTKNEIDRICRIINKAK